MAEAPKPKGIFKVWYVCCGHQKILRRWAIAFPFAILFHIAVYVPIIWLVFNSTLPGMALLEFSELHRVILNNVHSGRRKKYQVLHRLLIQKLNNKYITMAVWLLINLTFITMTAKYVGLILIFVFIGIIHFKIYSFNSFMN